MHSLVSDSYASPDAFDADLPQGGLDARTLTKAELADLLFERVGLNKREAKDMVETFFEEIRDALERGDMVKLSGFGNFQVRNKPQRPVTFHASQKLKSMVEQVALREQNPS